MKKIFILLGLALLLSCAPSLIKDNSRVQYYNKDLTKELLSNGGLALFPIISGEGQEGYRRPLGDSLNILLSKAVPSGKTITWQKTMENLNEASKVDIYEDLIRNYKITSILNRKKVRKLESALNVRFALMCTLQENSRSSRTVYNPLVGYVQETEDNVKTHALLLDLHNGDIMLEIIGETHSNNSGGMSVLKGYDAYIGVVARSILSKIPGSIVQPPPKPKPTQFNLDNDD